MIIAIHHVQITVAPDEETAARRFYCEVLGLPEVDKPDSLRGRGGFWVQLGAHQLHVGVESGVDRTRTKAHVAYQVDDLVVVSVCSPPGWPRWRACPFPATSVSNVAIPSAIAWSSFVRYDRRRPTRRFTEQAGRPNRGLAGLLVVGTPDDGFAQQTKSTGQWREGCAKGCATDPLSARDEPEPA